MLNSPKQAYYNLPRFFELDFYNSAKEKFIERYSNHKDVLSIYIFGQVSVPGISDLDFLVIMKDFLTESLSNNYSVARFDEDLRYIYNDTQPFIVPQRIYEEFWKIFPTNHLERIFGKEIQQKIPSEEEARLYKLMILIEVCHYFYPIIFLKQLGSDQINVRFSLLTLNALKFPLKILMELCGATVEPWIQFIVRVADLRECWFQLDNDDRCRQLNDLLHEAANVSIDLIEKLHRFIEATLWSFISQKKIRINERIRLGNKVFISEFNPEKVLENTLNGYKKTGKWQSYLPITFVYPLFIYSSEEGYVSAQIARLITDINAQFFVKDDNVPSIMIDRIRLMNKHGAFYKDNAVSLNMVHSYYGYNPNPGHGEFYQAVMRPYRLLYRVFKNWRKKR